MNRNLNRWILVVIALLALPALHAQFAKDDEIELARDEPLLFNNTAYRQGHKGERFRVQAYRADMRKIYLLATDAAGKQFALNVSDAAVTQVRKDVGILNEQAFAAVRTGRLVDAQRSLLQVAMLDPDRKVCTEVALHIGTLSEMIQAEQNARKQQELQRVEVQRKLRSAELTDRLKPTALHPDDTSSKKRAEQIRMEAKEIEQNAEEAVKRAGEQIASEVKFLDEIAGKRLAAHAYSEALDITALIENIETGHLQRREFTSSLHEYNRKELEAKVAKAQQSLEDARLNVSQKKLTAAHRAVEEGLRAEPGAFALRLMQAELNQRLDVCGKTYALALSQQGLKHYEQALQSLEQVRAECVDHDATESLATALKKTIEEKDERVAKARTDENAGNFASALETYDTYALSSDAIRVLPLYAKQRESAGDYLLAYTLYRRAGQSEDMQRTQKMKNEQIGEYEKARVLLTEEKFADALIIYRRYKDTVQEKDALRHQAAFYESQEKFDEAIEIYQQAQLPDEIARVKDFVAGRSALLADAKHQEQAANFDKALNLFQQANAKAEVKRVAENMAKIFEEKKDYESAAEYFEIAGSYDEAGRIRKTHDLTQSSSLRKLTETELFKRCGPACVTIISSSVDSVGLGSGFFVAKGGFVLTNNHVIEGASQIKVQTSSNKEFTAEVVGKSDIPDLALLKIETQDHPVLKLGDSDRIETGARVSTIGSPKGQKQSYTAGNISSTDRVFLENKCFQISVLINHGNSGGPLLDEMGQVIGITTFGKGTATVLRNGQSIGSDIQGMNYAIKINEARKLLKTSIPGF